MIRLVTKEDLPKLYEIWLKFYKDDFPFPLSSTRKQLDRYVITDNEDNILVFGMIELYPEINAMSNFDASNILRLGAYRKLLRQLEHDSLHYKMNELYASVRGEKWEKLVRKYGFTDPNKKILVKRLKNGKQ